MILDYNGNCNCGPVEHRHCSCNGEMVHVPKLRGLGFTQVTKDFTWGDVWKSGVATGFDILKDITDPKYKAGTFYQETPQGVTLQRAAQTPVGFGVSTFPSTQFSPAGGDIMKWILIGGGLLVGLKVLSEGK